MNSVDEREDEAVDGSFDRWRQRTASLGRGRWAPIETGVIWDFCWPVFKVSKNCYVRRYSLISFDYRCAVYDFDSRLIIIQRDLKWLRRLQVSQPVWRMKSPIWMSGFRRWRSHGEPRRAGGGRPPLRIGTGGEICPKPVSSLRYWFV